MIATIRSDTLQKFFLASYIVGVFERVTKWRCYLWRVSLGLLGKRR